MKKWFAVVMLLFSASVAAGAVAPPTVVTTLKSDDIITKGPWVDLRSKGAKEDGSDSAPAIAAAISALPSTGGVIFLPPQKYRVSSFAVTKSNVTFYGPGATLQTLSQDSPQVSPSTASGKTFIYVNGASNVVFDGITFDGSWDGSYPSSYSDMITTDGVYSNFTMRNCTIQNIKGEAFIAAGTGSGFNIEGMRFLNVRNSAAGSSDVTQTQWHIHGKTYLNNVGSQSGNSNFSINSADWLIEDVVADNVKNTFWKIGHPNKPAGNVKISRNKVSAAPGGSIYAAMTISYGNNIEIEHCVVDGFSYGINGGGWANSDGSSNGDGLKALYNRFTSIGTAGISSFRGKSALQIIGNECSGGINGIVIYDGTKNAKIVGNTITGISGKGIWFSFINVPVNANLSMTDNYVDGNTVDGAAYGMYLDGRAENNFIGKGNVFKNCTVGDFYGVRDNTFFNLAGNKIEYSLSTIPTLEGSVDGTNQSPSLNMGNNYVTPPASAETNYLLWRFDNGYEGMDVFVYATDAFTQVVARGDGLYGANIAVPSSFNMRAGRTYHFRCMNGLYYLISPDIRQADVSGLTTGDSPTFTGIVLNEPSGFIGNTLDLRLDGTTKARVTQSGGLYVAGSVNNTTSNTALALGTSAFTAGGNAVNLASMTSTTSSGTASSVNILPTYVHSGTAGATDLRINRAETSLGSGTQRLASFQVSNVEKFGVDNAGRILAGGGSANKAICWKSDGKTLGYCSTAVAADGGCTCN